MSICRENAKKKILKIALITLVFLMIPFVSSQAQCPSNLTNYWWLDESGGSIFIDSAGTANASCSSVRCPARTTGRIHYGLLFDGVDDALEVPPNESFNWGNEDSFSIEFWMKTDPGSTCTNAQVIIGRDDALTGLHWWLGCNNGGRAAFYLSDKGGSGDGIMGTKDLTNGSWHHIVGIRDAAAGEMRLYVDGANEASKSVNFLGGFDSAAATLNIGWLNLSGGYHFQGAVDEVALYSRVLSQKEIRSHFFIPRDYCDMCSVPIAIMPLGDSITRGSSVIMTDPNFWVGYRQKLFDDLGNGGYNVDFVGSLSSGGSALPAFDINHEGHGGWCADGCPAPYDDIRDHVYNFLTNNPAEVVLLHLGTNDISGNHQNPAEIGQVLDEIKWFNPHITVLVALIISRTDGKAPETAQFNDGVEALVLNRIAQGDKIILVDQESALNYINDLDDPLHPNQAGYNKMAGVWLLALNSFLPACSPAAPQIISTPVTGATVGQVYSYDVIATGAPAPTYALMVFPSGMTIDAGTGLIQWTPTAIGQFNVMVEAWNTEGVDTQSFTVTVGAGGESVRIWLEGEDGALGSPMVVAADAQASSGEYVWVPNGRGTVLDPLKPGGTATYTFYIPQSGDYVIWGRLLTPTESDDSFFVSVDSGAYTIWDTLRSAVWGWDLVSQRGVAYPAVYPLAVGQHTLVIKQREDGAKIDRILITNDLTYVPQGQGGVLPSVPVITSVPVTGATVGQVYGYDVSATGEPAPTYTLLTFPAGMTINEATGLIQWTPAAAGPFDVTVKASNTQGVDTQSFVVTVSPGGSSVQIWLEGEGGSLNAPMVVASDAQASSGEYVWVPQGRGNVLDPLKPGGTATYTFYIPQSGDYVIWGRLLTPTESDDSFFVSVDSGAYTIWDTLRSAVWGWDLVSQRGVAYPAVYPLAVGQHTLVIKQREDGAKLDRILITNDLAYVPQGLGN